MTQEQIEVKVLEEFPVLGDDEYNDPNESRRAAFIKGCQYAATPSGVSREDAEKWIKEKYPSSSGNIWEILRYRNGAMAMYDHLASLSPAQPGYSEARPIEAAPQDGTEILGWCDLGEDGFQWRPVSWPTHSPLSQAGKEGRTGPWQYVQDNRCRYPKVTHWMPLPSSPLTKQP